MGKMHPPKMQGREESSAQPLPAGPPPQLFSALPEARSVTWYRVAWRSSELAGLHVVRDLARAVDAGARGGVHALARAGAAVLHRRRRRLVQRAEPVQQVAVTAVPATAGNEPRVRDAPGPSPVAATGPLAPSPSPRQPSRRLPARAFVTRRRRMDG
ncbi:Protein of unknown function [Gryllus bimaculatus]|nr:Protein of unknown function [Gryllus bimaculatus]